jgi:hypothetical protein
LQLEGLDIGPSAQLLEKREQWRFQQRIFGLDGSSILQRLILRPVIEGRKEQIVVTGKGAARLPDALKGRRYQCPGRSVMRSAPRVILLQIGIYRSSNRQP